MVWKTCENVQNIPLSIHIYTYVYIYININTHVYLYAYLSDLTVQQEWY
jgi:hypothetical protein